MSSDRFLPLFLILGIKKLGLTNKNQGKEPLRPEEGRLIWKNEQYISIPNVDGWYFDEAWEHQHDKDLRLENSMKILITSGHAANVAFGHSWLLSLGVGLAWCGELRIFTWNPKTFVPWFVRPKVWCFFVFFLYVYRWSVDSKLCLIECLRGLSFCTVPIPFLCSFLCLVWICKSPCDPFRPSDWNGLLFLMFSLHHPVLKGKKTLRETNQQNFSSNKSQLFFLKHKLLKYNNQQYEIRHLGWWKSHWQKFHVKAHCIV